MFVTVVPFKRSHYRLNGYKIGLDWAVFYVPANTV